MATNKGALTTMDAVHVPQQRNDGDGDGDGDGAADDAVAQKVYEDEIQRILKKGGFQQAEPPVIDSEVIEVPRKTKDEDDERRKQLLRDLQKERIPSVAFFSSCVIVTALELTFMITGNAEAAIYLFGMVAVGSNSILFLCSCLNLKTQYNLKNDFTSVVADCKVLRKVKKRAWFSCGLNYTYVLVFYRVGKSGFLKVFHTQTKARQDYIQIGQKLDYLRCRHDNPRFVVYVTPEMENHRRAITAVGFSNTCLHLISILVAFLHTDIKTEDAMFLLYATIGGTIFGVLYLSLIGFTISRRKVSDYVQVVEGTATAMPTTPSKSSTMISDGCTDHKKPFKIKREATKSNGNQTVDLYPV